MHFDSKSLVPRHVLQVFNIAIQSPKSTHCGLTDESIEVYYRKLGFPPHFGRSSMVNNVAINDDDNDGTSIQQPFVTNDSSPFTQDQFEKTS